METLQGCLVIFVVMLVLSFGIGSVIKACEESDSEKVADKKRSGFHCLDSWDGSHLEFKKEVISRLNDPDSFEHVGTRATPEKNGEHVIGMEFRAKNAFGGTVRYMALGTYRNATCKHKITDIRPYSGP